MKIIIYCGKTSFKWSPFSVNEGIGGSEEAVIYQSQELKKLGHEVIVYNSCEELAGNYDGIEYKDSSDITDTECDILIVWRIPRYILDLKIQAKKKYLWMHDMAVETELLPFQYLYDKILVLSQFHRSIFPKIADDRFYLTRNGVKYEPFTKYNRIKNKLVYCSNYDRGLIILLENWTKIISEIPDAHLYVMYGWQTLSTLSDKNKEEQEQFKLFKNYVDYLMSQENIHHLGRVSHKELAQHLGEADIWAYPCIYPEVSCISAMKAQIAGAYPIYLPTAALKETIKYGSKPEFGDERVSNNDVERKYTEILLETLNGGRRQEKVDFDFTWQGVAKEWDKDLIRIV